MRYTDCSQRPENLTILRAQVTLEIHAGHGCERITAAKEFLTDLARRNPGYFQTESLATQPQPGDAPLNAGQLMYSAKVWDLLSSAGAVAVASGTSNVGVEHLLLALLRSPQLIPAPEYLGIEPNIYGTRLAQFMQRSN